MPPHADDRAQSQNELRDLINSLDLTDVQKQMTISRWLDQLSWMEGRAAAARDWHYRLRLTTIAGGVLLPALVSLDLSTVASAGAARAVTVGISVMVALSAAVEEFFHYGERWRHYRRNAEHLKTEGWEFFQLADPYRRFKSHRDAHALFAGRVEDLLRQDIDQFVTTVAREPSDEPKAGATDTAGEGGNPHGLP